MKKIHHTLGDDMRPEYDSASMKGGVRGRYAKRFREGTNIVLLDPAVVKEHETFSVELGSYRKFSTDAKIVVPC